MKKVIFPYCLERSTNVTKEHLQKIECMDLIASIDMYEQAVEELNVLSSLCVNALEQAYSKQQNPDILKTKRKISAQKPTSGVVHLSVNEKVRLFVINRKIVLYIVLIIVPFVIRDFFSASQTILETGKHYDLNKYINMTYKSLVLAAFTEEVVYRGMIFSELCTHFKLMPSAIIQSTIFTLVHSEMIVQIFRNFDLYAIIHILAVFAMGILAAGMTHRTKSLWPSIIMHFALDGGIWYIMLPVMQKII